MAPSHVIVIDGILRHHKVQVNPNTPLSTVLEDACKRAALEASQYDLKHNNNIIDLSRSFRLSGLSSGAKLTLVQRSRSASPVSIALEIPDSDGPSRTRLKYTFPSDTTLWQILRHAESEDSTRRNFTARGVPQMNSGDQSGAGRLFYEMPALLVGSREVSTFSDLQKTLGQLGCTRGSHLLRLSFKRTEQPLEEAVEEIDNYFKTVGEVQDGSLPARGNAPLPAAARESSSVQDTEMSKAELAGAPEIRPDDTVDSSNADPLSRTDPAACNSETKPTSIQSSQVGAIVYAPSESSIPPSSKTHNEGDYDMTLGDFKRLHGSVVAAGQPGRLKSTAQEEEERLAKEAELAKITRVKIKVLYPDQFRTVHDFDATATAADVYADVRKFIIFDKEKFRLKYTSEKGPKVDLDDDGRKQLVKNLGFRGGVVLTFVWDEDASLEARAAREVLKSEHTKRAVKEKPYEPPTGPDEQEDRSEGKGKGKGTGGGGSGSGLKGVPKWLRGGFKK